MCKDCGCGLPGENPPGITGFPRSTGDRTHSHSHDHGPADHTHEHGHPHDHHHHEGENHAHAHEHTQEEHPPKHAPASRGPGSKRAVEIHRTILEKNDRLAERNRGFFRGRGLLALNVVSSPGSGKTTLLRETIRGLEAQLKCGVIVGDLATDNDAQRLRESGAPVVQVTTGTVCHLEAEMVTNALRQLDLKGLDLVIIENVGNLVCPASYDLGETLRVVLLSVTEGEDKPLKYPPMFQSAHVVVVSKVDLSAAADFRRDLLLTNLGKVSPRARIFETSARTGQGMEEWRQFLVETHRELEQAD